MSTSSRIRIRRRQTGTSDPTSDNLLHNEMGYAEETDTLWYRDSDGNYRKVAGQGMGDDRYLRISQNLSEIADGGSSPQGAARTHLGLGNVATRDVGTSSNNVPVLDTNGKLSESVLPAIAIAEIDVVADIDARTALDPDQGDVAIVEDASDDADVDSGSASYIYDGSNWQKLRRPEDAVVSVFGRTGAVTAQADDYTWDQIDKSSSDLADIGTRPHSALTNILGSGAHHLSSAAASSVENNHNNWLTALIQDSSPTLGSDLYTAGHRITALPSPQESGDAARRGYVDSSIAAINHNDLNNIDGDGNHHLTSAAASSVESNHNDWITALAGDSNPTLNANMDADGNRITNLPAPQAANDAARRQYVDDLVAGISEGIWTENISNHTAQFGNERNWIQSSNFRSNPGSVPGWTFAVTPTFAPSSYDSSDNMVVFSTGQEITQTIHTVPGSRYLMAFMSHSSGLFVSWAGNSNWDVIASGDMGGQAHTWVWRVVESLSLTGHFALSGDSGNVSRPFFIPVPINLNISSNSVVQDFLFNFYTRTGMEQIKFGRAHIGSELSVPTADVLFVGGSGSFAGPLNLHGYALHDAVIDCGTF